MLKLNPVSNGMAAGPRADFKPLIGRDLVRIVARRPRGGCLAGIQDIAVHMTGSAATHDAVVCGAGADGADRRARNIRGWTRRSRASSAACRP